MVDFRFGAVGPAHRNGVWLLPGGKALILRDGNLISSRGLTVIDHRGLAFPGQKASAAEHAMTRERRLELGSLPRPVQQVRTCDVDKTERTLVTPRMCQDVVQMVLA